VACQVTGAGSTAYNGVYVQMSGPESTRNGAPQLSLTSKVSLRVRSCSLTPVLLPFAA